MSSRPSRGAARLASILDALPDALLLVNCNGTVVNANTIAIETFESPGTALVGRGLLDLLPAFDSTRIPGSMRAAEDDGRTKPTRMVARRTDGHEFPVEVTSANLEDGRTPYAEPHHSYTGDELLMLVVRDLTGTLDTEAELARQQRQTEMILRAAAEGVVGVDTEGKVVLVNPSAAQILGYRATDLGGQKLHPLVHHSRQDGSPLPYEETPLADTLRSGRKHRVRGQALWRKDGRMVPVDLTTAPVRDGEQLVGAVMTFTDRSALDALTARNTQLQALLDDSLRGPLAELRTELTGLAADPAGQLWPEANQILHHLAAGYARITTLVDNVLAYQRLDRGEERLRLETTGLDTVVAAGVDGAVALIGPGRAQYAVHAPPIEAVVDAERMSQALAHLIADVAGVDASGNATIVAGGDSTIVVAAAQRGDVVRIDVRGPNPGGNPVHLPLARGIIERHGGVLQTHEVPGQGSAYVLEVPLGDASTRPAGERVKERPRDSETTVMPAPAQPARGTAGTARAAVPGARAALPAARTDRPQDEPVTGTYPATDPRGGSAPGRADEPGPQGGGSREGAPTPAAGFVSGPSSGTESNGSNGSGVHGGSGGTGDAPVEPGDPTAGWAGSGEPGHVAADRAPRPRGAAGDEGTVVAPWALPAADRPEAPESPTGRRRALRKPEPDTDDAVGQEPAQPSAQPTGRRARRTLTDGGRLPAAELPAAGAQNALPAAGAPAGDEPDTPPTGRRARRAAPQAGTDGAGAPGGQPHEAAGDRPTPKQPVQPQQPVQSKQPVTPQQPVTPKWPEAGRADTPPTGGSQPIPGQDRGPQERHSPDSGPDPFSAGAAAPRAAAARPHTSQQAHAHTHAESQHHSNGRAISVRTLGQGIAFAQQIDEQHRPQHAPQTQPQPVDTPVSPQGSVGSVGSGRRRKLNGSQQGDAGESDGRPHPQVDAEAGPHTLERASGQEVALLQSPAQTPPRPQTGRETALPRQAPEGGRAFAIGAPAEGDEGPEPLDGPNGAVDVTDAVVAGPRAVTGPAPALEAGTGEAGAGTEASLESPRRLLVWPEPDVSTRQALSDRGYRPVIVRSREEVDAQIAEPPAALFVDPLTGPITRTALQSLRQAAMAAQVPVLVTAGLGQATREAAYGADPAVLLKALAPRDSEQHPPRVLLVEQHQPIAQAFAATLERRGMQVAHAPSEADAMTTAAQMHPNLVVMDLMLVRRRRQGIIDWLRANDRLTRTPVIVYTSVDIDPAELPRLASGETVLFLAERSTSADVQSRIVDLLGKIGTWTP